MQKLKSLFVAFIVMLVTVSYANSMEFKNMVMFGESTSDNGNFLAVSGGYPPAPYYQGRFSDGPVWFEYLTEDIGVTGLALNYAHGGAMTGNTNVNDTTLNGDFPGFADEIEAYLAMAAASQKYPGSFAMPKDTLFVIWIGGNDLLNVTPATAAAQINASVVNIKNGLLKLIDAGASKFMMINLPNFGNLPRFNKNTTEVIAGATQLSALFNQALEQVLAGVEVDYSNITIQRIDMFSMHEKIIDDVETLGGANQTDAKLNTSTGKIADGNYLFWDEIHPTTFGHKLMAKNVAEAINCENCKGNMSPSISSDYTITIPSAKVGDQSIGFTLMPYKNTTDTGYFWKLDMDSLKVK